eukprot:5444155-Amphidinium_carterae.1
MMFPLAGWQYKGNRCNVDVKLFRSEGTELEPYGYFAPPWLALSKFESPPVLDGKYCIGSRLQSFCQAKRKRDILKA